MKLNTKNKRLESRKVWIGDNKTEIYKDLEILSHETSGHGYFSLIIWKGTAAKPYINYYFKTIDRRQEYIDEAKRYADQRAEYKEKQKTAHKTIMKDIKRGDIYYCSWGYDQTNYDYIVVLSVSPTGKTVKAQKTSSLHMGTSCQSNVQEPIFCPFGDIFTLQVRDGYLIGSYPFCHDGTGSRRRGYFSKHTTGKQYHKTMAQFGH